jgi:Uma2 family endonuclease
MTATAQGVVPAPDFEPPRRVFTAADLVAMPSELPSGTVLYELHHGRLIAMPPAGDAHGAVASNITTDLKVQGERRGLGKARCNDTGLVLARNPDHVLGPDVVFIAASSLPIRRSPEGYLETIPDLVAEVRSKNDSLLEVQRKVADYLTAGVRVIWVADPDTRTVTVHRRGHEPQVFRETDTLTVEDVIPGFRLPVAEVFKE